MRKLNEELLGSLLNNMSINILIITYQIHMPRVKRSKKASVSVINLKSIATGVIDILESPEISNLIESGQNITVEISRPVISNNKNNNTKEEIGQTDCIIKTDDGVSDGVMTQSERSTTYREYRNEILNGICRQTSLNSNYEMCFEERCYVVTDATSDSNIWIVTIRNKCSAKLMPLITDYDQTYEFYEKTYSDNVREIGKLHNSLNQIKTRYDIFNTLDSTIVMEGSVDELQVESRKVIEEINQTYQNMCNI
jgi:hypothetical protein